MTVAHAVPETDLQALATGLGGPATVERLWAGQKSRRLRWVWLLLDAAERSDRDAARAAISAAARKAPAAVRELLVQPFVGAWAAHLLESKATESGLGALAVATAMTAGTVARAVVATDDGHVVLPGSGLARAGSDRALIATEKGRLWVDGTEVSPGDGLLTARTVRLEGPPSLTLRVEDVDPHRDVFQVPATARLPAAELAQWHAALSAGWQLLARHAPERAAEAAAGLQEVVPLSKPDARVAHSATSTTIVGVIGLDAPTDPAELAVTIVHEFQHSKLAALHDIDPLHRDSGTATFHVPWRADRRPVAGALQGLYAFFGVADMWRALMAEPATARAAEMRFAEARAFIRDPATEIMRSPALTASGQRFAGSLAAAIEELQRIPLSDAANDAAERSLAIHRSRWA